MSHRNLYRDRHLAVALATTDDINEDINDYSFKDFNAQMKSPTGVMKPAKSDIQQPTAGSPYSMGFVQEVEMGNDNDIRAGDTKQRGHEGREAEAPRYFQLSTLFPRGTGLQSTLLAPFLVPACPVVLRPRAVRLS